MHILHLEPDSLKIYSVDIWTFYHSKLDNRYMLHNSFGLRVFPEELQYHCSVRFINLLNYQVSKPYFPASIIMCSISLTSQFLIIFDYEMGIIILVPSVITWVRGGWMFSSVEFFWLFVGVTLLIQDSTIEKGWLVNLEFDYLSWSLYKVIFSVVQLSEAMIDLFKAI